MKKSSPKVQVTAPKLLLIDVELPDREPRAAVVWPGRLPIIFPDLSAAVEAIRDGARA